MRTIPFPLGKQTFHLLLNGAALFEIYEKYGDKGSLTDPLNAGGKGSFESTCFFLARLAEQGELWRRYLGYDPGPIPTEELFRVGLSPMDVTRGKRAILEAACAGFAQEEAPERKEVDLGLLELQKKTERG